MGGERQGVGGLSVCFGWAGGGGGDGYHIPGSKQVNISYPISL